MRPLPMPIPSSLPVRLTTALRRARGTDREDAKAAQDEICMYLAVQFWTLIQEQSRRDVRNRIPPSDLYQNAVVHLVQDEFDFSNTVELRRAFCRKLADLVAEELRSARSRTAYLPIDGVVIAPESHDFDQDAESVMAIINRLEAHERDGEPRVADNTGLEDEGDNAKKPQVDSSPSMADVLCLRFALGDSKNDADTDEKMSFREIAAILGCSPDTAWRRYQQASELIRQWYPT